MSNSKADNFLINLDWKRDLFQNLLGEEDYELAGKRLVYLFLSMENIMKNGGEQIFSKDPDIDYTVRGLLLQLSRMRRDENGINEEDKDRLIAQYRIQGLSAQKISDELLYKHNIALTESGIRKRRGWKEFQNYFKQ